MDAALLRDGEILIREVRFCVRLGSRLKGLLGTRSLGAGRAIFIAPCAAIHTFFMCMALDVVFVSRDLRVTKVVRNVRPFRMVGGGTDAWGVLEMEAGWFPEAALREGQRVSFRPALQASAAASR